MSDNRPYVVSIAGFDPSAGAGVLADIKTYEQHQVYGFGICSALTIQSDAEFHSVKWLDSKEIIDQLEPLTTQYPIKACKIGIVKNWEVLRTIVLFLRQTNPEVQIVLDPVLKASAGYAFHASSNYTRLLEVLSQVRVVTPNYQEVIQLAMEATPIASAKTLSNYCAVFLKGGHNPENIGVDYLFDKGTYIEMMPSDQAVFPKHGSGCVLSAAIAANLSLNYSLEDACLRAKRYVETFLGSHSSLLGYHSI